MSINILLGAEAMNLDKRLEELQPYVGRLCVYIEGGRFSVARITEVSASDEGMQAVLEAVPEQRLVCHYHESPPRFVEQPHPIGDRWEITKRWDWFYPDEYVWDGSAYLGFRIVFAPDALERFLRQDLTWVEEYFG
jgi:hypothetical protein